MVSSLLTIAKGELPNTSPFDLSKETNLSLRDIWTEPVPVQRGELWITYPFEVSCVALDRDTRFPDLATSAKTHLDLHVRSIVEQATNFGVEEGRAEWAVRELLTNATQYGASNEHTRSAGMIRLEWFLDHENGRPVLSLAVANPCLVPFDPSRFARMEIADFYSMDNTSSNGHVGTIALMSYLQEGTKLTYLWEMSDGERVKLTMELIPENAPDRPANYDDLMKPTRVEVFKFDSNNQPAPYSFNQFRRDIEDKVAAESVTVSCVIAGSGASVEAEGV